MEHYVGLDVSLKQTAICIVDRTGKVQREGIVSSDPEAIAAFIKSYAPNVVRIASSLNKPGFERCGCHRTPCYIRDKVARITLSQRQLRSGSHSGLLEPRGASTVRNPPGVRDMTIWSVIP